MEFLRSAGGRRIPPCRRSSARRCCPCGSGRRPSRWPGPGRSSGPRRCGLSPCGRSARRSASGPPAGMAAPAFTTRTARRWPRSLLERAGRTADCRARLCRIALSMRMEVSCSQLARCSRSRTAPPRRRCARAPARFRRRPSPAAAFRPPTRRLQVQHPPWAAPRSPSRAKVQQLQDQRGHALRLHTGCSPATGFPRAPAAAAPRWR